MSWSQSLTKLFSLKSEAALYQTGAQELIDVVEAYLMPPSIEAAHQLKANWPHKIDNIPTNPFGLACAELAKKHKEGQSREDGSPSIVHEYSQIFYLTSLEHLEISVDRPDLIACICALHDLGEDYGLTPDYIRDYLQTWLQSHKDAYKISDIMTVGLMDDIETIVENFDLMSRFIPGHKDKMEKTAYFRGILNSALATIAKTFDRVHNIATLAAANGGKDVGKKLDETGLLLMSPIYKIPDVQERMKYFKAAAHLHPQHADAYKFLSEVIGTALNMHIAHRVNQRELEKHEEFVISDLGVLVSDRLKGAILPKVLRPLHSLAHRAEEFDNPGL